MKSPRKLSAVEQVFVHRLVNRLVESVVIELDPERDDLADVARDVAAVLGEMGLAIK